MRESDKSSDKMRRKRVSSAFSLFNLLEKDLGLKLFIRTHRGLVLTEAGKSLYTTRIYASNTLSPE